MRMKRTLTHKGNSGEKGQSVVELAIALPIILLLLFGVYDYSRAVHATSIITQMSREAANLVARPNTGLTGDAAKDFQNVMYYVAMDAGQLKMIDKGTMYITEVDYVSGSGNNTKMTVVAQEKWFPGKLGKASSLPKTGAVQATDPSLRGIILTPVNPVAYVVEVYYEYNSFFLGNAFKPTLKSVSIF